MMVCEIKHSWQLWIGSLQQGGEGNVKEEQTQGTEDETQ